MKKPIHLFLALFATLLSPASPRLLTPVSAPSDPTLSSMKHATPIDRVHFDGGYIDDDGKVNYHIGDYQGNVLAVMRGNGIVVQTAHYYPYGEPWLEPDGTNRRLYGSKERIAALGGAYDYGARLLNARVGTWYQQDPCAEDYRWLSPYSVCAADPVNHIDPDGRKFTEASMLTYGNYLSDAWRRYVEADVDLKDQYLEVITELMTMEASDQLFHAEALDSSGTTGMTYYDMNMNAVVMAIPEGNMGLIAHEFKHGYQFLEGEMRLSPNIESGWPIVADIYDEKAAYNRGALFGGYNPSIDEIKASPLYDNLYEVERSMRSISSASYDWNLPLPQAGFYNFQHLSRHNNRVFRFGNKIFKPR